MNSLFSYQRKCYKYQENKKFARTILGHSVLLLKKYKSIYYLFLTSCFFSFACLFVFVLFSEEIFLKATFLNGVRSGEFSLFVTVMFVSCFGRA